MFIVDSLKTSCLVFPEVSAVRSIIEFAYRRPLSISSISIVVGVKLAISCTVIHVVTDYTVS